MKQDIVNRIQQSVDTLSTMAADQHYLALMEQIAGVCVSALQKGHKILFMGNGGSAADSQHLAAELVSRFEFDRPGLAAFALTTDTSALTAIGNDYGYEKLFARQVQAVGQTGDVVFGLSTSGSSANILAALKLAKQMQLVTIGMTGNHKKQITSLVDYCIEIPSANTAKIQEGHIVSGHVLCALIEGALFTKASE